jgi:methionyl aminopeptidase
MLGRESIEYKTPDQVRLMRRAGLVVADALDEVRAALKPGVTTKELDSIAEDVIRSAGAIPSFLGYAHPPYPASTCISVNDEVVHGIPGARALAAGDVVSVDCGAILAGWHGDSAFTAVVPAPGLVVDPAVESLVDATEQAMWLGLAAMATGSRVIDIGAAVEDFVGDRYGLVEEYGGHGIGTAMHQAPNVLNYRTRGRGARLRPGMCLAVEPMLTLGHPEVRVLADEWTVATVDGGVAAHWEHTCARLDGGVWVLTARDGGVEALSALGVPVTPLAD